MFNPFKKRNKSPCPNDSSSQLSPFGASNFSQQSQNSITTSNLTTQSAKVLKKNQKKSYPRQQFCNPLAEQQQALAYQLQNAQQSQSQQSQLQQQLQPYQQQVQLQQSQSPQQQLQQPKLETQPIPQTPLPPTSRPIYQALYQQPQMSPLVESKLGQVQSPSLTQSHLPHQNLSQQYQTPQQHYQIQNLEKLVPEKQQTQQSLQQQQKYISQQHQAQKYQQQQPPRRKPPTQYFQQDQTMKHLDGKLVQDQAPHQLKQHPYNPYYHIPLQKVLCPVPKNLDPQTDNILYVSPSPLSLPESVSPQARRPPRRQSKSLSTQTGEPALPLKLAYSSQDQMPNSSTYSHPSQTEMQNTKQSIPKSRGSQLLARSLQGQLQSASSSSSQTLRSLLTSQRGKPLVPRSQQQVPNSSTYAQLPQREIQYTKQSIPKGHRPQLACPSQGPLQSASTESSQMLVSSLPSQRPCQTTVLVPRRQSVKIRPPGPQCLLIVSPQIESSSNPTLQPLRGRVKLREIPVAPPLPPLTANILRNQTLPPPEERRRMS